MRGWYYIEKWTGQQHDRVQTESQELQPRTAVPDLKNSMFGRSDLLQILRKPAAFSFADLCIIMFRLSNIFSAVSLFRSDMLLIFNMVLPMIFLRDNFVCLQFPYRVNHMIFWIFPVVLCNVFFWMWHWPICKTGFEFHLRSSPS